MSSGYQRTDGGGQTDVSGLQAAALHRWVHDSLGALYVRAGTLSVVGNASSFKKKTFSTDQQTRSVFFPSLASSTTR